MNTLELAQLLSSLVIAVGIVVIAIQLACMAMHLQLLSRSAELQVRALRQYLKRWHENHDPIHHRTATHPDTEVLVWEWRNGQWNLRSESVTLEQAGPPPNRAGAYDGECITSRRNESRK